MRFPVFHCQLTRVVLETNCLAGDKALQNAKDDFSLVLLMWKYQFWQLSVKRSASVTSEPANFYPGRSPVLRPHNSWDHSIIFQLSSAFWADRHIYTNHIQASANLS